LRAITLSMSAGTACRLEADANRGHRNFDAGARKPIPAAIRGPRATRHERHDSTGGGQTACHQDRPDPPLGCNRWLDAHFSSCSPVQGQYFHEMCAFFPFGHFRGTNRAFIGNSTLASIKTLSLLASWMSICPFR